MTIVSKIGKWLPLTILVGMAMAFEPIRSGFEFAYQSCELLTDWERVLGSVFNLRHVISYGILCLVAAATLGQDQVVKAMVAVFLFSVFIEFEQSFFITGHCRSWDLIPNLLGIGLAAATFLIGALSLRRVQSIKSDG